MKILEGVTIMLKHINKTHLDQVIQALCALKLEGMADALSNQYDEPLNQDLSFLQRIELMIVREHNKRDTRKINAAIKRAGFRQQATPEHLIYDEKRGINRMQIMALLDGTFIRKNHNVLITGATGCGKSYLACALGLSACRGDFKVKYLHIPSELEQLDLSLNATSASYSKLRNDLIKPDLLILDDFGLMPLNSKQRHSLFNIIEDRHGTKSCIITSQLPVKSWHDHINEPTIADAMLDRLLHKAHRIELTGGSMRKPEAMESFIDEVADF
jgi:DNA replication protein DnaC